MKLTHGKHTVDATTPRGCYDALIQAMIKDNPALVLKQSDCRKIKAQVLKSLGAEDWHPKPVVAKPAEKPEGFIAKVKKALKG